MRLFENLQRPSVDTLVTTFGQVSGRTHAWIRIDQVGMTDFGQHKEAVIDEAKDVPVKAQAVVHPLGQTPGE